jgi:membrane protein required for colicin V production
VIKELFGLIGIIGGVFVASRLASDAGYMINDFIPMSNENTILLVGFVASLVLFWILAYFLGIILQKIFNASGLGIFDKVLGFVFGAGKVFLLFSIIAYAVSQVKMINDALAPKVEQSVMFPLLKDTGGYIIKLDKTKLQNDVTKQLDSMVDSAKKTVEDATAKQMQEKAKELEKQLMETSESNAANESTQIKE